MNRKGFTIIEVLGTLVLISIITIVAVTNIQSTLSASKEESYKIMKNNIISVSYDYIKECEAKTLNCDFSFENNNQFKAIVLKETGYFQKLESPIDGKDLGECLIIEAKKENGVIQIDLKDLCY